VLSPGVDMKFDAVPGYSRDAAQIMPHAYNTALDGKRLLRRQLDAMRDGGVVVMVMPTNPYRCPPGPYERACMIAGYLKARKPRSKIVILDPKKSFSKEPVFKEAFAKYYPDLIELNQTDEIDDYAVVGIDLKTREIATKAGKTVKADVANIIPPQRAGEIALKAGAAEGDWCPIDPENFSSKMLGDVYILGDSANSADMPKSAFSANSQAKVVAADILVQLAGKEKSPPRYRNTCWSLLAVDDGVKVGASYLPKDGKLEPFASFVSQSEESADVRKQNYQDSIAWYQTITDEMFAKVKPAAPIGRKAG
jgi:NADPH-dependent 2,4-dienoyl-CoA reductase/sulfur reductase-like enzyme